MLINIKESNEFAAIVKEKGTILVDFYATWCGPCRMLGPVLEEVAEEKKDVTVVKVNVDEFGDLAQMFHVSSIPALFLIKDGKAVKSSLGYMPKDRVIDFIEQK